MGKFAVNEPMNESVNEFVNESMNEPVNFNGQFYEDEVNTSDDDKSYEMDDVNVCV